MFGRKRKEKQAIREPLSVNKDVGTSMNSEWKPLSAVVPEETPASPDLILEKVIEPADVVKSVDEISPKQMQEPIDAPAKVDEPAPKPAETPFEPPAPAAESSDDDSPKADIVPVGAGTAVAAAAITPGQKKKFALFRKKEKKVKPPLAEYDMDSDGPLVFPEYEDDYEILDSYWAIRGLCFVSIIKTVEFETRYLVFEPKLTDFEHTLLERLDSGIREILILRNLPKDGDKKKTLYEAMTSLIRDYKLEDDMSPESIYKLRYYLERSFFGWGRIDVLRCDYDLEDISCDGYGSHVFIYHRQFRDMKTNILFENPKELDNLVASFAQKAGKHISLANPIVDASLSDGSRIQLTYSTVVSAHGSSFTIRKFKPTPFSPVELLTKGTFTPEELAFLWIAVENGKSMMIVGGTASGKTTTLNAVSQFIPKLAKVVSIEDTREITLDHENWIASVVPPESPGGDNKHNIAMFDLLKAAMRQRPEYILVGEVRGIESQTLFQAINTGHATFSTMHASDIVSAINRLTNPPLDVPKATIQALDLVVTQAIYYKDGAPYRRIKEVVEIIGMSEQGGIEVNSVFSYDPANDSTSYSGNSKVYKDIMQSKNFSHLFMQDEIRRRTQILEALVDQKIFDYREVGRIIWMYRSMPNYVMDNIGDLTLVLKDVRENAQLEAAE